MVSRRLFQAVVAAVAVVCLLALSGVVSAQGRHRNDFERVRGVQHRHTEGLMARPGVVGTAVGLHDRDGYGVLVLLDNPGVSDVPGDLEGVPVHPVVTGHFYALARAPQWIRWPFRDTTPPAAPTGLEALTVSGSEIYLSWQTNSETDLSYYNVYRSTQPNQSYVWIASQPKEKRVSLQDYLDAGLASSTTYYYVITAVDASRNESRSSAVASATTDVGALPERWWPRPVPIGVSTGHPSVTAGTIGCRVKDSTGKVYALSNNHVYANENRAWYGDNVLQPGAYDGGVNPRDAIGTLRAFRTIIFSQRAANEIDAAIALASPGTLDAFTPDGWAPSSTTRRLDDEDVGLLRVKKYGRTTGLTSGTIYALSAIVNVTYDSGTARFVNQIVISPGSFCAGGDSGSLVVTEEGHNPVGLLFAGSSDFAVANPIDAVLSYFGVTVDSGQ